MKSTPQSTIHVVMASDDNYFEGLLTTSWSLARNCCAPHRLSIHILDGGITDEHWRFFENRIAHFHCQIDRIAIETEKCFSSFVTYHGNGRMTYARLLLPDLLPDIHQIIYCDVDILWIVDVAELWDHLNPKAVIHCVPTQQRLQEEIDWCARFGYTYEIGKRFIAGILVMNLDKFRAEGLHKKMLALISDSNGKAPCNDESALNAVLFGRRDREFLESRWQRMSSGYDKPLDANGFVLHYLTDTPWQSIHKYHHLLTYQHILWHCFHAEARKIGTWESLKSTNSICNIILCRFLAISAVHCIFVRILMHIFVILKGHGSGFHNVAIYMKKFNISRVNPKLLPN